MVIIRNLTVYKKKKKNPQVRPYRQDLFTNIQESKKESQCSKASNTLLSSEFAPYSNDKRELIFQVKGSRSSKYIL